MDRLAGALRGARRRLCGAVVRAILVLAGAGALLLPWPAAAQQAPGGAGAVRIARGRFTAVAYPSEVPLVRAMLADAVRRDSFPGLPRPRARVLLAVAPDSRRFRAWVGPAAPEWGAAIAFPALQRIVMQGRSAGSGAGDPLVVLRHELAHLALHEYLGDLPPRWFDEGYASYAAGEWGRDEALATSLALLVRGMPTLDSLDVGFGAGAAVAEESYALAFRAVQDLAALDPERGLALFFQYWKETGRFERAVRLAYGVTADGFEREWQRRTRRRFGALALFANLSLAVGVFLVVFLPLWIGRRRRDRARLEALREADRADEREARESALALILGGDAPATLAPREVDGAEPGR